MRGALLEARVRLGLTQAQAAALLGTRQSNLSAYEQGRVVPGAVVSERIAAFIEQPADSIFARYSASTLASAAAQIRADLIAGRSDVDMLRVVIQASDDFARLTSPSERALFLAEPSPTGDRRWDAMLAGLAVHLCRQARMERVPLWTRDANRMLDVPWWFGSSGNRMALTLRDAIPSLRARGVMLSRRNLESV